MRTCLSSSLWPADLALLPSGIEQQQREAAEQAQRHPDEIIIRQPVFQQPAYAFLPYFSGNQALTGSICAMMQSVLQASHVSETSKSKGCGMHVLLGCVTCTVRRHLQGRAHTPSMLFERV